MSKFLSFLKIIGCIALLCFVIPIKISGPDDVMMKFNEYLKKFNKTYSNETEYYRRLKIFQNALKEIENTNAIRTSNASALYGLTKFSDLTRKEFEEKYLNNKLAKRIIARHSTTSDELEENVSASVSNGIRKRAADDIPEKVDWRINGTITKVKNQGHCGACWAFVVIENLESMIAIKGEQLEEYSVQEIIDCAEDGNQGCSGGDMCSLLGWMTKNKVKVVKEKEYPLKLVDGQCRIRKNQTGIEVFNYACKNVAGQEYFVTEALAKVGPVAAAVNAILWQNYLGGVIHYNCDGSMELLNHAVQIVGYDLTAEIPHYIVRNSWGPQFGDNGYLYIAIGENMCGIANEVSTLLNVA